MFRLISFFTFVFLVFSCETSALFQSEGDLPLSSVKSRGELKIRRLLDSEQLGADIVKQVLPGSERFQGSLRGISQLQIKSIYPIGDNEGGVLLYFINYSPTGYAIVSARRSCYPILAYSDKGEITPKTLSPNLKSLVEDYKVMVVNSVLLPDSIRMQNAIAWESLGLQQQRLRANSNVREKYIQEQLLKLQDEGYAIYDYQALISDFQPYVSKSIIRNLFPDFRGEGIEQNIPNVFLIVRDSSYVGNQKDPMLKTSWHQIGDYSKYVPHHVPQFPYRWPVGCVAVAVGQIMRYHQFPREYDWVEMLDELPTDATAKFLYDVALGVNMSFGEEGSGSNIFHAQDYLSRVGYELTLIDYDRLKVYDAVEHGGPVYLRGYSDQYGGSHAFVADGCYSANRHTEVKILRINEYGFYDAVSMPYEVLYESAIGHSRRSFLHLNLGFNGSGNGYYDADGLFGFSKDKKALINIRPKNK